MDYPEDSDIGGGAAYLQPYPAPLPPQPQLQPPAPGSPTQSTIPDLNLSVLRRHHPSITSILAVANHAKSYIFDSASLGWVNHDSEGPFFVCSTRATSFDPAQNQNRNQSKGAGGCIFLLNRKSLDNLVVDLAEVDEIQETDQFLILRLAGEKGVLGLFLHQAEEEDGELRRAVAALIRSMWERVRLGETVEAEQE